MFSETLDCEKVLDEFEFTFLYFIQASDKERGRHRTAFRKIQNNANITLGSTSFFSVYSDLLQMCFGLV